MKNKEYLLLQMFADPAPLETIPTDPAPADPKPEDKKEQAKPEAKYTDEDLNKLINKKFAEWQEKKEKELTEAKKLAEMNAQERAEHERDEMKRQLETLMKQQSLTEMTKTARAMLTEKEINVSDDLLSMLVSEDADKTKSTIDSFVELFQGAVKSAVADALKGNTPKTGAPSGVTKEQIMAVKDRAERQRLIRENMELFK
ncbi:DUF4355 domain-containing protein [Blautia pseudococcoides]|uniref:DUF4355 domain-containing protein n=1 Tax=Blautia pseudococcoides TaxID=1796616 RepID=UPI003518FFFA